MHTAICTFEDRDTAERARDRLVQAGFARRDIHVQHGDSADAEGWGEDPRGWEGTDREVAASRDVVDKVAGFFVRLFGADDPERRHESWSRAVGSGRSVLVVDNADEQQAQRAREMLHDLQAADVDVCHRTGQLTVDDIVGVRAGDEGPDAPPGFAGSREPTSTDRSEGARERALAAGVVGEQRPLDLRDPDGELEAGRRTERDKPSR